MPWYVYILESEIDGDYYKGSTQDYLKRLEEHNTGLSKFTSTKRPWKLRYAEVFSTKKEALIREKQLKRQNRTYLTWLFNQSTNLLIKKSI
jgi:putative endonuclease